MTTYEITKYWNKLLTPLSKSECILNTEDLIKRLTEETIPTGYKMIFFDMESLFTNAPLDKTIDFILEKVYDENPNNHSQNSLKRITISLHQTVIFHSQ